MDLDWLTRHVGDQVDVEIVKQWDAAAEAVMKWDVAEALVDYHSANSPQAYYRTSLPDVHPGMTFASAE